ncbi:hypothetical protein M9H77_18336 [Catharanthus roseus]|uniref:Uncharacterized protein n=2 Tax=Catharanthus roseus TaxID=4058 RepID=A0ACC0B761_CATRO|nr:hypothetical protein M9H77_18334 [Catharanthus roseus]KAI5668483.1 hypothetical protein M9H77_18336 [Catharanthus roseus]
MEKNIKAEIRQTKTRADHIDEQEISTTRSGNRRLEPKRPAWEILLNRTVQYKSNFKAMTDFVTMAIPIKALKGLWKREISDSNIPFPHRKGNMYNQYLVKWADIGVRESRRHLLWMNLV